MYAGVTGIHHYYIINMANALHLHCFNVFAFQVIRVIKKILNEEHLFISVIINKVFKQCDNGNNLDVKVHSVEVYRHKNTKARTVSYLTREKEG